MALSIKAQRGAAIVALMASGLASPAQAADPFWLYQGDSGTKLPLHGFYVAGQIWGGVQQLPRFRSTWSSFFPTGGPFFGATRFEPDVAGVQPGGGIGYVLRDGSLPAWLGQRVRIEFSGHATAMETTERASRSLAAGGGLQVHGINGAVFFSGLANAVVHVYDESLKVEHEGFGLRLKAASDFALAPSLTVAPAIAIFGGRTTTSFNYRMDEIITGTATAFPGEINERLQTREIGVEFGATATWQFMPGWALHGGAHVAPVWQRTRLRGVDCFNNAPQPIGTPCGPANPAFSGSTASDSRSTVDLRAGGALGVSADFGFAVVTMAGTIRYDSRIPGVANPQAAVLEAHPRPAARIRYEDGLAYGGMLRIAMPLRWWGL